MVPKHRGEVQGRLAVFVHLVHVDVGTLQQLLHLLQISLHAAPRQSSIQFELELSEICQV